MDACSILLQVFRDRELVQVCSIGLPVEPTIGSHVLELDDALGGPLPDVRVGIEDFEGITLV